jgi:hypothetical protein
MKETVRMMVAGATGAVLATAVLAGQPALAGMHLKTAAKNSVTSKSIKNATIKTKDLSAEVTGPLAKAGTALQSVPDNSVTSAKVADNSLTAADLGPNSVAASEIENGSLDSTDLTSKHGTVNHDSPSIASGSCDTFTIPTGAVLAGDLVLVNADLSLDDGLSVSGRSGPGVGNLNNIQVYVCNHTAGAINPPLTTFGWGVIEN